ASEVDGLALDGTTIDGQDSVCANLEGVGQHASSVHGQFAGTDSRNPHHTIGQTQQSTIEEVNCRHPCANIRQDQLLAIVQDSADLRDFGSRPDDGGLNDGGAVGDDPFPAVAVERQI